LIRATKFIGQGTDKLGKKGFAQKEQLEVGSTHALFATVLTGWIRSSKSLRRANTMYSSLLLWVKRDSISVRLT
jgi:hypothetical protein